MFYVDNAFLILYCPDMDLKHLTGNELEKSTVEAVVMDRRATAIVLAQIQDVKIKAEIIKKVQNKTKDETEKILFSLLPGEKKMKIPKDLKIRVSDDEVRLSITVSDRLVDKTQHYKSLSGKSMSNGELFELALDLLIDEEEHRKFKKIKKSPPAEKNQ